LASVSNTNDTDGVTPKCLRECKQKLLHILIQNLLLLVAEFKFAKNATVHSLTESPEIICWDVDPIASVTWFKNGLKIFNNTGKYTTSTSFDSGRKLYGDALKINNFSMYLFHY